MRLWPTRSPPPDPEAIAQRAASAAVAEYRAEQERAAEVMRASVAEAQEMLRAAQQPATTGYLTNGRGSLYPGTYARDHPYYWSQPGWSTWRPGSLLTVDTLRQMALRYDVLRAMVNYLKDHVATIPLQIVARNAKDDSERVKSRINFWISYRLKSDPSQALRKRRVIHYRLRWWA